MQEFNQEERLILLNTARDTINYCLKQRVESMAINLNDYSAHLREPRACFVTLHLNGHLRGCIGSLQAHQPLILDVIHNAYNAAAHDPRFMPVSIAEAPKLTIDISVLSVPEPMSFDSEQDLLAQIRPSIDGLILSDAGHRGTFLPSVWEQLPDKTDFLNHLKQKAGLPTNYWSNTIKVERYTAELID
jgi:AmmeMemoRadiSam system protein A